MEVQKVLSMNGGDGDNSYAKNSFIQKEIIEVTRSVMKAALFDLYCTGFSGKLSIADLGCSSGPNALTVASDVVFTVSEICRQVGRRPPEFQIFLNDLPGNDFNSTFHSLQEFYDKNKGSGGIEEFGNCFVAGVPGSFYGRLFTGKSIDFFHSSSSLHWLSQVPEQLQRPDGPVNRSSIYISELSPPSVVSAYALQFQKDFSNFLRFRSEEMVAGGYMVLILVGRKTLDPTSEEATFQWNALAQALMDMVEEGLIPRERVDSFNAPYYSPCALEVENEVRKEGSFSLRHLETFEVLWDAEQVFNLDPTEPLQKKSKTEVIRRTGSSAGRGRSMATLMRAVLESMLTAHFGGHAIDDIFERCGEVLEDYLERKKPRLTNLVVSLVRKPRTGGHMDVFSPAKANTDR